MHIKTAPAIEKVFDNYPDPVRKKLTYLRNFIVETAKGIDEITVLEETLKWGEPSFLTKQGSTIRIDWKKKKPDHYAIYFQCTSKLVPTFIALYKDTFTFEGNRAIVFQIQDPLPHSALKNCIRAALMYHKVKHLPTLGI